MNAPTLDARSVVSAAEWEQRVALAACYRLVARFGWDDL
ncbi:MAG: class II aldolase, partial [Pseudomonadota bacterium]